MPLYPLSVYPISRQSDIAFTFYGSFVSVQKQRKRREKTEETKPIFDISYLGMLEAILLKFGLWDTNIGGHVHNKIIVFRKGSMEVTNA